MLKEALEVINEMQRDGVINKYAIGGAIGALFYIEPSLTKDIDIFVTLPTLPGGQVQSLSRIYEYLLGRGFTAKAEYIIVGTWPVQFLPATTALELEALNEAVQAEYEGVTSWVMTAEHLVAICLQTGRLKDYARIGQFIEHQAVDMQKLERVIGRNGLADKWKLFNERYPHES
jgi:hypothetical protein